MTASYIDWSTEVGIIAFGNSGGLAIQCKRIYDMLGAKKILLIDSSGFSPNKDFNPNLYPHEKTTTVYGFPKNYHINEFIKGIKYVFCVENPYNFYLVKAAREAGVMVICQTNYEFCENLTAPWLPLPDKFLMPSYWYLEEMIARFPGTEYLPPPINTREFENQRHINLTNRSRRFLHIVGTLAFKDRNGTLDLLRAFSKSNIDYGLTVHSQHQLPKEYVYNDSRITYSIGNKISVSDIYAGYDALILPRRYGGLSLTTNEALISGLPVLMTDISPNNRLLPKKWLFSAKKVDSFQARDVIDCYSADYHDMISVISSFAEMSNEDLLKEKMEAFNLGYSNFSTYVLRNKYQCLI